MFGARGTGKSTLLKEFFKDRTDLLVFDLLNPQVEMELAQNPRLLYDQIRLKLPQWVLIDEVQKLPALLDIVHSCIEDFKTKFALSGSSARKLKRDGANMLAGRAVFFRLYPLTPEELGDAFDLQHYLQFGGLPLVYQYQEEIEKIRFLKAYCLLYLKEEIILEQLVRKVDSFRNFLGFAAQANAEIINYSKISKAGLDSKSAKFYFFDCGVARALHGLLDRPLHQGTYEYGKLFETFIFNYLHHHYQYKEQDVKMSFLRTKEGEEIDLIIERPGDPTVFIEVKSSQSFDKEKTKSLVKLTSRFKKKVLLLVYQGEQEYETDTGVKVINWKGLKKFL